MANSCETRNNGPGHISHCEREWVIQYHWTTSGAAASTYWTNFYFLRRNQSSMKAYKLNGGWMRTPNTHCQPDVMYIVLSREGITMLGYTHPGCRPALNLCQWAFDIKMRSKWEAVLGSANTIEVASGHSQSSFNSTSQKCEKRKLRKRESEEKKNTKRRKIVMFMVHALLSGPVRFSIDSR